MPDRQETGQPATGGASGDLYVLVHVSPHKLFGRSGSNLTLDVPVTFTEASLGAEIEIPTLQGRKVKLRIPAATPNGRTMRVRGKGARLWDSEGREYIDLLSGIAVTSLGHCNEEVTRVMCDQAATLVHVSNLLYQERTVILFVFLTRDARFCFSLIVVNVQQNWLEICLMLRIFLLQDSCLQ